MAFGKSCKKRNTCLYLGKGVIQMVDACIPVHSISDIEVAETRDKTLIPALILIVAGVGLYLPGGKWQIAGTVAVVTGILGLLIGVILNFYKVHHLKVQVHAGKTFLFGCRDIMYIRKVMEMIRDKIEGEQDKTLYYLHFGELKAEPAEDIDMSRLVRDSWRTGDFAEWDISTLEKCRDLLSSLLGHKNTTAQNMVWQEPVSIYSDEEWGILENFFARRCNELGMANELYKTCQRLKECAKERDALKMHETIKGMHRAEFQMVLGDIDTAMKKLLLKVLKMK